MSYHEGSNWQANKEDKKEPLYPTKKWRRYRFLTNSVDDERPLIFNPSYPWWIGGYGLGGTVDEPIYANAVIVAWLPVNEDLKKYWDDAHDIDFTEHEKIEFTERFSKPEYYIESLPEDQKPIIK